MSDDLTLVPPTRLGALLTAQRTKRGLTIDELLTGSTLGFTIDELRQIEQGQLLLSDDQINRLMMAYDTGAGPVVPERAELIVDLHHGAVFAGSRTKVLPPEAGIDDVLGRYLSLLYLMRGMEPGRALVLRDEDVAILSRALERSITDVEARLFELMAPGEVAPWFRRVSHRLAVPTAGILVGLTTVGSLVLVQFPDGDRPLVRDADGNASGPSQQAPASAEFVIADADAELAPAGSVVGPTGVEVGAGAAVVRVGDDAGVVFEPGDPGSVGAAAEELLSFDFRSHLPGWTVDYTTPREGYRGSTNTITRTISIYVGPTDTPPQVLEVLAHEVGHAFDVMYLDRTGRDSWLVQRNIDTAWWPDGEIGDFDVGAGDFAEAVAAILADSPSDSDQGAFSDADLNLVRALIPDVGL